MPKQFKVVKWYTVNLPDKNTDEWTILVQTFLEGDPDYVSDPENMEPQVLEGNIVAWLATEVAVEKNAVFADYVDLTDYTVDKVEM